MSAGRGGNVIALVLSQVVVSASGFVVQIVLARFLGPESFGLFGFIASVVSVLAFVADLNLQVLLAREVARDTPSAGAGLGNGLLTITFTSSLAVALSVALVGVLDGRPVALLAALFAGLALGTSAARSVVEAVFQGLQNMRPLVVANLVGRVIYLGATLALLALGFDVVGVFAASIIGPLLTAVVLIVLFIRRVGPIQLGPVVAVLPRIRETVPFLLGGLFTSVYLASDVLVIKAFHGDDEVGMYRAASLLLLQLGVVAVVINRALYPRVAKTLGSPEEARIEVAFGMKVLLAVSLPLGVGGLLVGDALLPFLVGVGYESGIPAFLVLMPLLPVRFLNNLLANALSALDQQKERTIGAGVAAGVNVVANLALVPFMGAFGAAITTVASDAVLLVFQAWRLSRSIGMIPFFWPTVRLLPALAALGLVVWLLPDLHVALRVLLGGVAYVVVAWGTGALTLADLRRIRRI
ncbi:MAG: flippase [Myxococcota bacterium]